MKNLQNQITILLVESNSDWLVNVYSSLQQAGYDVLIATGGDEGFCVARRRLPDLIISETAMPDISGVELCYMIRADKELHATPFILVGEAGSQDGEAAFEGFRAGADDYFEENCRTEFLEAKVTRLVELRRSEADLRLRRRNLHSSESHLTKIIEDASNLIEALEPTFRFIAFGERYVPKPKSFFSKSAAPKKSAKALEIWKRTLQTKDRIDLMNKSGRQKREKVFFEVVC